MRRIERSPGGTGAAQWPAQEGSGSYPHPTMPRPCCTQCCSRAPLFLMELPMAPGAKIRCWCKEDWCIDCAAGDRISQLLFLPPCWLLTPVLIPKSLSVQRESGSGWGVYCAQSLIYGLLLHSTLWGGHIQLRVLWPLSIPLQREKTEFGWAGGVGCFSRRFFGTVRTIPLKSQLPMNLPILIWISGAGIPAGHPNLPPG